MTAPATPIARPDVVPGVDVAPGRARPRARALDGLVEGWLRGHTLLVYLFLYVPILVVVIFSFNATQRRVTQWEGFSLRWYESVLHDTVVQSALFNSFRVAIATAIISTVVGTMAALGMARAPRWFRGPFEALTFISIIVPEIVIALSTLVFYSTSFDIIFQLFHVRFKLGYETIVGAHALFNISLVLLLVRARLAGMDRTHVEASYDLYGTPWRTFWQITFPQLLPAIVAGFLLSFTFSFDDYVITFFVYGAGLTTLPLYIFSSIRQGVTPATNAIAAIMLLITLTVLVVGQALVWRNARRSGQRGAQASVAGMIAEQSGG
jgi:spermidine/putrescine transport system permease protein